MPVEFRCTKCRRRLRVPKRWAGDAIDCPRCAAKIIVPQQAGASQGGVFESRSFERSLRKLDSPSVTRASETEKVEEVWDAASLASFDPAALPLGESLVTGGHTGQAAARRSQRRPGRAVGLMACLGFAVLASTIVAAAFCLFKR